MAEADSRDEEFSGTRSRGTPSHQQANLDGWMKANVEGYKAAERLQFKGGQSDRPISSTRHNVVRAAPKAVRQAAAVGARRRPRVPRHLALPSRASRSRAPTASALTTASRLDVLHHVDGEGPVFWDQTLPSVSRGALADLRRGSRDARQAAQLRPEKIRLGDFGRPATISRARSTAGPSSIAPPRPRRSRRSSG